LVQAVRKGLIKGVDIPETDRLDFCEGCVEGKMSRKPFKSVGEIKSTRKLQLVHSDVCGPMPVQSFSGKRYFVTFIDDYSRCVKVYFIKQKSEVLQKFREFEASATNEAGCKIGTLRTDNGGEYMSSEFEKYLRNKGIKHETSVIHSPQQNGVAERMNRTLLESARAMVYHAGLSKVFWAEAVNTAAYIRNRVTTATSGQTPYERWYERIPDVSKFRVFGCMAYAHVPEAERRKLDKKAIKLRFLGYGDSQKGYRLYDVEKKKVVIRRDVAFNETDFGYQKQPVETDSEEEVDAEQPPNVSEEDFIEEEHPQQDLQQQPRRSEREVTHMALHAAIDEPATIQEAWSSKYSAQWKAATDSEYQSLMENKT